MCKIFHVLFRTLFAASLVLVTLRGMEDIKEDKGFVSQNLRLLGEKVFGSNILENFRQYSALVLAIEYYLLLFSACLVLVGTKLSIYPCLIAIIIELVLVHNPVFYTAPSFQIYALQYLGIFGGILLI